MPRANLRVAVKSPADVYAILTAPTYMAEKSPSPPFIAHCSADRARDPGASMPRVLRSLYVPRWQLALELPADEGVRLDRAEEWRER